jgi:hypothetical protein
VEKSIYESIATHGHSTDTISKLKNIWFFFSRSADAGPSGRRYLFACERSFPTQRCYTCEVSCTKRIRRSCSAVRAFARTVCLRPMSCSTGFGRKVSYVKQFWSPCPLISLASCLLWCAWRRPTMAVLGVGIGAAHQRVEMDDGSPRSGRRPGGHHHSASDRRRSGGRFAHSVFLFYLTGCFVILICFIFVILICFRFHDLDLIFQ